MTMMVLKIMLNIGFVIKDFIVGYGTLSGILMQAVILFSMRQVCMVFIY